MSGSRRETEAERAKRKRKEADDKNSQTAESRAARANSRSAGDDGLVDASATARRRVSQAGSPSPSPVSKPSTHPVVAAHKAKFPGMPFVLAPAKTSEKCSLKAATDPIFEQFLAMHGKSFVARMPMRDLANLLLRI